MYGLIGKMKVTPGQRDALIALLLGGVSDMPGCLSYVVAQDPADADIVWITEVWDSQASHLLRLPQSTHREAGIVPCVWPGLTREGQALTMPHEEETLHRGAPNGQVLPR